jgi:hypothetical protein
MRRDSPRTRRDSNPEPSACSVVTILTALPRLQWKPVFVKITHRGQYHGAADVCVQPRTFVGKSVSLVLPVRFDGNILL